MPPLPKERAMRQSKYTVSVDIAAREKMAAHALFLDRVIQVGHAIIIS